MQPHKYNISIIGNNNTWINAIGEKTLRELDITEEHRFIEADILTPLTTNTYAYGLLNTGCIGGMDEITAVTEYLDAPYAGYLLVTLKSKNLMENYKYRYFADDYVCLGGFKQVPRYNGVFKILNILDSYPELPTQLLVQCWYSADDTGYARPYRARVYVEDMTMLWNAAKVFEKIINEAGYKLSSTFIDSADFIKKYIATKDFIYNQAWIDARKSRVALSADKVMTTGVNFIIPFDTSVSGDITNWSMANNAYLPVVNIHGIFMVHLVTEILYHSAEHAHYAYITITKTDVLGVETVVNNTVVQTRVELQDQNNYNMVVEQEIELRMLAAYKYKFYLNWRDTVDGSEQVTIYKEGSYIEFTPQGTIVKGSTIHVNDFLPEWKQIDFIKAIRHLFNLKFLTDEYKKVVYCEPRDDFYTDTQVDWTDRIDFGREIKIEELGADVSKQTRLAFQIDTGEEYDNFYKEQNGYGWASDQREVINLFASKGEDLRENSLFAASLMDYFGEIGLWNTQQAKAWQKREEGETLPKKYREFAARILNLQATTNCTGTDKWVFEDVQRTAYTYLYFYDYTLRETLMFGDLPSIKGLCTLYYTNHFRTLNYSRRITAYLNLSANDLAGFLAMDNRGVDFRALYVIQMNSEALYCRLAAIEGYSPGKKTPTKCVFITNSDQDVQTSTPNIHEITFTNNVKSIDNADAYANGAVHAYQTSWALVHAATIGNDVLGDNGLDYGVGSFYVFRTDPQTGAISRRYCIERGFLYFDTSSLPDNCTIIEAVLGVRKYAGSEGIEFAVFEGLQGNSLSTADYHHFGTVLFGESSGVGYGLREVILNSFGIAKISKIGYTKFCLREKYYDVNNISPITMLTSFKAKWSAAPAGEEIYLRVKYSV